MSRRVRAFLDQHGIGWVTNPAGEGTYAALQDVCALTGGFWLYELFHCDEARDRRGLPRLPGQERWLSGPKLEKFLQATGRPAADALLIANEARLEAVLQLRDPIHDAIKDELALLCTFAGIRVHNEVPLLAFDGLVRTRRPDLCLWIEDQIWVVDVKTSVTHKTIAEMSARCYAKVVEAAYGHKPSRLLLVSIRPTAAEVFAAASDSGWEIYTYSEFKQMLLEWVRKANALCPYNYERVVARF